MRPHQLLCVALLASCSRGDDERLSPAREADWLRVSEPLRRLLLRFPETQKREVAKGPKHGRFVRVRANTHGIGNRLNAVVGAFALALVTDRALAIEWRSTRALECQKSHLAVNMGVEDRDCDPVALTDIYELPFPNATNVFEDDNGDGGIKKCGRKNTVLKGDNDLERFVALLNDTSLNESYRADQPTICAESDRHFGWAVTCNRRDLFPDGVWPSYGLLQDYLLRPVKAVRDRVGDHAHKCTIGIHLRKVWTLKMRPLVAEINATVDAVLLSSSNHHHRHPPFVSPPHEHSWAQSRLSYGGTTARGGGHHHGHGHHHDDDARLPTVFLATDPFSMDAARAIKDIVLSRGLRVIEADKFESRVTRSTANGLLDAVTDHALLASCDVLLPLNIERSTFHDTALAKLVWRRHLDPLAVRAVISPEDAVFTVPKNRIPPPLDTCYVPTLAAPDRVDYTNLILHNPAYNETLYDTIVEQHRLAAARQQELMRLVDLQKQRAAATGHKLPPPRHRRRMRR